MNPWRLDENFSVDFCIHFFAGHFYACADPGRVGCLARKPHDCRRSDVLPKGYVLGMGSSRRSSSA
jgi:hypothetical protein